MIGAHAGTGNRCGHDRHRFMEYTPRYLPTRRQPKAKLNLIKRVSESGAKPKAYERITHHYDEETGDVRRQGRSDGRDRNCYVDLYFVHHVDYERGCMGKWDGEKVIPFTNAELIADIRAGNPGLSKSRIEHRIEDAIKRRTVEWVTETIMDQNGYKKKITTLRITDEFYRGYKSMADIHTRRAWVNQEARREQSNQEKRGFARTRDEQLAAHNLKGPAKPGDHELIARINREVPDRRDRIRIAKLIDGLKNPRTRQVTLKRFSNPEPIGSIINRCLHPATGPPQPKAPER